MAEKQIPVVLALIRNPEGEIFLIQRNDPGTAEHLTWGFPGGKIQFGEDPIDAMIRETKEETGFDVEVIRLLPRVYQNVYPQNVNHPFYSFHVILLCYECKITGGELKLAEKETLQGKYFKPQDIDYSKTLRYTKEIVEMLD